MPITDTGAIRLTTGTVSELWLALGKILAEENKPDALVVTEVGLSGGRDCFVGAVAHSIRVEFGGRVVISADERAEDVDPKAQELADVVGF